MVNQLQKQPCFQCENTKIKTERHNGIILLSEEEEVRKRRRQDFPGATLLLGACRGWGHSRRAELLAKLALGPRGQLLEGRINDSGLTGVLRMTSNIDILLEVLFRRSLEVNQLKKSPAEKSGISLLHPQKSYWGVRLR